MTATLPTLLLGLVHLDKPIRLNSKLAQGNFGTVFAASCGDQGLVLKQPFDNERAKEYLKVEADVNRLLQKRAKRLGMAVRDRVAPYHGMTTSVPSPGGPPTLIWEATDGNGQTLDDYLLQGPAGLEALKDALGVPRVEEVPRRVLRELCSALALVHACGIVHRDIKPENLLVDPSTQTLRLIDFGSACDVAGLLVKRGWRPDRVPCSVLYCAPEQRIEAKAPYAFDVYSAALVWLCVAVPSLAQDERALYDLRMQWKLHKHDLEAWRRVTARTGGSPPHQGWVQAFGWEAAGGGRAIGGSGSGRSDGEEIDPAEDAWELLVRMTSYRPERRCSAAESLISPFINSDCATEEVPLQALDARSTAALASRSGVMRTLHADECVLPAA